MIILFGLAGSGKGTQAKALSEIFGWRWISVGQVIREIPGFPVKLASELKHCIVAHHGELEYGSPKKPALAEAVALNFADCTDARMQSLTEIFKEKDTVLLLCG